jgi:hypothetical protein
LQYFSYENWHHLEENIWSCEDTNCFVYLEHSLKDFDSQLLFSLVLFHTCSIALLLTWSQLMKSLSRTRIWSCSRDRLICHQIICYWLWARILDWKMINFEKNSLSRFLHTVIRIYILSHFDLQNYIFKLFDSQMKIVRDENQHNALEEEYVVHWREEFEIQEVMLIYFELRTLFDLRNRETSTVRRCFRYLNKTVKIEFELRMLLHLCLKRNMISKNYRDASISLKRKQNLEIYQDVIVSSEESTANENWFQKVLAIELITIRMMILKRSKKRRRRALFRRRKFDVLIRSI